MAFLEMSRGTPESLRLTTRVEPLSEVEPGVMRHVLQWRYLLNFDLARRNIPAPD